MFLRIDPDDGLAIYDQVVRQMKFAIAGEALKPGDLVPSVRELARDLAINPNTVSRAYLQLQHDGILETVRGVGLSVAAGSPKRCRTEGATLIRERLAQVFEEARLSHLDPDDLRKMVHAELEAALKRKD
jgi:GntR family transcriptional regulator